MARGSAGGAPKGGKKNRKFGSNKVYCERYRREDRETKNRRRRLRQVLRRNPTDTYARVAFERAGGNNDYLKARLT